MSEAKTRQQYVFIDVVRKDEAGVVSICGPSTVVENITEIYGCYAKRLQKRGQTAKAIINGDYQLTKACMLEEVLKERFVLLSDVKEDSLILSREVKL